MTEWQGFYSTAQVSRLASIPLRTLYSWKARGIIKPSVHITNEHGQVVDEGYSYADLAIIKLMRALRVGHLNLRSVATSLRHLFQRLGPPTSSKWSEAHVYILNKQVFAYRPDEWDTTEATRLGQRAEMRVLGELTEEEGGIMVPKDFGEYIEINPKVMEGQPVIKDTRVPTAVIAMLYKEGTTISELVELYRPTTQIHVIKAIEYEDLLDEALARTQTKA